MHASAETSPSSEPVPLLDPLPPAAPSDVLSGEPSRAGRPRRIMFVTSSRADWCHLRWPLEAVRRDPRIEPILVATAAMLAPEFGRAVDVIERDGFTVDERVDCLLASDGDAAMARGLALATSGFADVIDRQRPDAIMVVADRYEMLAPATAAMTMRVPIVHVEGGEASEGVIDHAVRNALSMLASHHFVTTAEAARRLVRMGEAAWRIHRTGAGSLDHLAHPLAPSPAHAAMSATADGQDSAPYAVVAYHPVTLDETPDAGIDALLAAIEASIESRGIGVAICHSNADAGGRRIVATIRRWLDRRAIDRPPARLFVNLEPADYWGLLSGASLMVGNSSSGIMESPSLGLPAVDVGPRQAGRERAGNILHAAPDAAAMADAITRALTPEFREVASAAVNPYGDGRAGPRIAEQLATIPIGTRVLRKPAIPAPEGG
ncbi:MAG: UDP-N-acetylglucosamine 2-epimerase [Phycisphaerales bacterium]